MILLLKVTLLFAIGGLLSALLARTSAAARHFVWVLTLSGSLALALAAPIAPVVPVRVAAWPAPPREQPINPGTAPVSAGIREVSARVNPTSLQAGTESRSTWSLRLPAGWGLAQALLAVWALGTGALLAWYGLGHLRLARMVRRATPLRGAEWQSLIEDVAARSGIRSSVALFRTDAVGSPLTWGLLRPVVILPQDAESWAADRRRVVLAHELAHSARGDYLSQLIACLACALYWFHPLAWIAARRLRLESERACDDQVLGFGVPGVEYAAHLLDVARRSGEMRLGGAVAIGMARRSQLEGRLLAVLEPGRSRNPPAPKSRIAAFAGLAAFVLPLAMIQPAARETGAGGPPAPVPGTLVNQRPEPEPAPVATVQDQESRFDRSVEAKPGEQLEIDLESGGSVAVRGWDRPTVQVRAQLAGQSWRDTRVTLERTDGGVRLHAWQNVRRQSSSTSHQFEIQVPRRFDVHINSAGGGMTIADVEGTFEGETGGGGYEILRAHGEVHLSTGGGDIKVDDSELSGSVSTGGGLVTLSRVKGGLRGKSGSGPVIYTDGNRNETGDLRRIRVDGERVVVGERQRESEEARKEGKERELTYVAGMLHIEKAGGAITLESAPDGAEVRTGGGKVTIGRATGFVSARTGGGDIDIGPVAGSVVAGTGAGTVHVWITDPEGRERLIEVSSGTGDVVLELPPGLAARFELETAYTENYRGRVRIDSDWELAREETTRWDHAHGTPRKYVRARGEVGGGGPLIKVRTVNGNVTVRVRNP